jgi:hypothetical protein
MERGAGVSHELIEVMVGFGAMSELIPIRVLDDFPASRLNLQLLRERNVAGLPRNMRRTCSELLLSSAQAGLSCNGLQLVLLICRAVKS